MQRNFTCVALSTLACLLSIPLIAQPVTTMASINYSRIYSGYEFDFERDVTFTLGTNMMLDLSEYGDIEIDYGSGSDQLSAPAKDVPVSEMEHYMMFRIDQNYRDNLGFTLPQDAVGIRYTDPSDEDEYMSESFLAVKPSGLYEVGYRYSYLEEDTLFSEEVQNESEELFIPFGVKYGEEFDTTITYTTLPGQYDQGFDSIIIRTRFQYLGYGTFKAWRGDQESVGAMVVTYEETLYEADENGVYGSPRQYSDTGLYLLTDENVIPRVIMYGEYNAQTKTFTSEEVTIYLPTSEDASATRSAGIPGAVIDVFPNPSDGVFRLDLTLDRSSSAEVELYSPLGQLISRTSGLQVVPGVNRIPVSTKALPAGVYLVRLELADGRYETRRVVVD